MTVADTVKTAGSPPKPRGKKGDVLLEIRGLRIEGQSDEKWTEIVKGVDLTLRRGEVLGLIGESGAGKSTIGLAAMAYARPGCRISAGTITVNSVASNGVQVLVYTETNSGATFTQKFNALCLGAQTHNFSLNVGQLQPGDTIYVAFGPNLSDGSDGFSHDFSVIFKETGNPLP